MKRDVSARLVLSVGVPATLVFSVAVAADYLTSAGKLSITVDGAPLELAEDLEVTAIANALPADDQTRLVSIG